jgi:hypothetical protein
MSKMRIETKPTLEAYIGKDGNICLKQEGLDGKEKTIVIQREYAGKIINWLQILVDEKRDPVREEFIAED